MFLILNQVLPGTRSPLSSVRYITNLRENAEEGTKLIFEGGLDRVEDLDKVFTYNGPFVVL